MQRYVLICVPKENQKSTRSERLGGGKAMKAPVGLSCPTVRFAEQMPRVQRGKDRGHGKGAARPFQTPKKK